MCVCVWRGGSRRSRPADDNVGTMGNDAIHVYQTANESRLAAFEVSAEGSRGR